MFDGDELESLPDAEALQRHLNTLKEQYGSSIKQESSISSFSNMETDFNDSVDNNMPAIISERDLQIKNLQEQVGELELQIQMNGDSEWREQMAREKEALQDEIRASREQFQALQQEREDLIRQMQVVQQQKDAEQEVLREKCQGLKINHEQIEDELKESQINCAQYLEKLLKVTNQLKNYREQNVALRRKSGSPSSDFVVVTNQSTTPQSGEGSPGGSKAGSTAGAQEMDTNRAEVTALQMQLAESKNNMAQLNDTISQQRLQLDEYLTKISSLNQMNAEHERQSHERPGYATDNLRVELQKKIDQCNVIEQQRDELRRELMICKQASSDVDMYREQYEVDMRRLRSDNKMKADRIKSLMEEIDEKEQEALAEQARLKQQLARIRQNVDESAVFEEQLQQKQAEITVIKKKLEELTKVNEMLKQVGGDTEARNAALQKTQESLTYDLRQQSEYMENKQRQLDAMNEKCAQLEERLQETSEDARRKEGNQERSHEDQIRNLNERHIEKMDRMQQDINALQSDLNQTREKFTAAKEENKSCIIKIKQLEQEKEQQILSMQSEHAAALGHAREENQKITSDYEEKNSQLQRKTVEFENAQTKLNEQIRQGNEALRSKESECTNLSEGLALLQLHYKKLNEEKNATAQAGEKLRNEKAELAVQMHQLQRNYSELEAALEGLRVERNEIMGKSSCLQQDLSKLEDKNRQLENTNRELKMQADLLPALQAQTELFKQDFDNERKSREQLVAKKDDLEEELRNLKQKHASELDEFQKHSEYLMEIVAKNSNIPRSHFAGGPLRSGAGAQPNQAQAASQGGIPCPVCGQLSPDIDSHQLHTMECLPD